VNLLLDENLPHDLRRELAPHDVYTAAFMRWGGVENGELLRRASEAGFDALITNDRGLEYEQNLDTLPLAVVVLLVRQNDLMTIRPLIPSLPAALQNLEPRSFSKIGPIET
jgi:hypothetical protein